MSDPRAAAVGLFAGGDPEILATYDRLAAHMEQRPCRP